jgi:glucose-6-phosphate isomerase
MLYEHLSETCLAARIGDGGLSDAGLAHTREAALGALGRLRAARDDGSLPLLGLPERTDDLCACRPVADAYRERFADVVVLGTGGSSLGGQALAALAAWRPRLHFVDNVDPDSFRDLLGRLDLARTGVLAISKSGATAETLAQLLVLLPDLEAAPGAVGLAERVTVISDPRPSPLRRLAERHGFACLDHEPGLGGRFSVLSNVGLLPAMIAGLDAAAVRAGAAAVLSRSLAAADPADAPPVLGAALAVGLLEERAVTQSVLMPYVDRLAVFARWYRQLWAESLGKDGTGTTPIAALGAVDQHSQLQLYLAGPRDKMFTLIRLETAGLGARVDPALAGDEALAYLRGRTLGDLMDAMARATAETLARGGRPTRVIRLERLDEEVLGALFMHFMLETIVAADLLGVNAFDQPAVEEGKVLARQYLDEGAA